jgi:hypothetical protein
MGWHNWHSSSDFDTRLTVLRVVYTQEHRKFDDDL